MSKRRPMAYVDSKGRVPRGLTDIDEAQRFSFLLMVKMVLDQGGRVVLEGMGNPEFVNQLLEYELNMQGLGDGKISIEAVRKDAN